MIEAQSQLALSNAFSISTQPFDTITQLSVHINSSVFKIVLFSLSGWIFSWIYLVQCSIDSYPFTNNGHCGNLGLLMWFGGHLFQSCQWQYTKQLSLLNTQHQYTSIVWVDALAISYGGGLYFWSTSLSQYRVMMKHTRSLTKRFLFGFYWTCPCVYMIITTYFRSPWQPRIATDESSWLLQKSIYMVILSSSLIALSIGMSSNVSPFSYGDGTRQVDSPGPPTQLRNDAQSTMKVAWTSVVFHGVFILTTGFTWFIPFVLFVPFLAQYNHTWDSYSMVYSSMIGGSFLGVLTMTTGLDFTTTIQNSALFLAQIPLVTLVHSFTLVGWYLIPHEMTRSEHLLVIAFFSGFSSLGLFMGCFTRTFWGVLKSPTVHESILNVYYMTLILPGSGVFLWTTRHYTQYGIVDFSQILLVSFTCSFVGFVACTCSILLSLEEYWRVGRNHRID